MPVPVSVPEVLVAPAPTVEAVTAPAVTTAATVAAAPTRGVAAAGVRNVAVDAYRGFVMVLMMAEVLHLARVARAFPDSRVWAILAFNQTHVPWAGCSLHDLIQPSFSFLVGVALPYSLARRSASGASSQRLFAHAVWRSLLLIVLGIFLRSIDRAQTYFTFEDTLTQIGLGYPILFLLGRRSPRVQWIALTLLLVGYWAAWVLYPGAEPGFAAHWSKDANVGVAFDRWFLNLFPRESPFVVNSGGYLTLSFIPTLGTMILGVIAGQWLRERAPAIPYRRLLIAGIAGLAAGALLHVTGVCPVVKRIWTPAWTLFSGGACFLLLAAFCWLIETRGYRRWAFPLVVVGLNSIAAYLIAHLFEHFIAASFHTHLGPNAFAILGPGLQPLLEGIAILAVYWLLLFWMYQRKLFLRI
jgi:heparan-alpha-glucosaminide N-acetyltransferase